MQPLRSMQSNFFFFCKAQKNMSFLNEKLLIIISLEVLLLLTSYTAFPCFPTIYFSFLHNKKTTEPCVSTLHVRQYKSFQIRDVPEFLTKYRYTKPPKKNSEF